VCKCKHTHADELTSYISYSVQDYETGYIAQSYKVKVKERMYSLYVIKIVQKAASVTLINGSGAKQIQRTHRTVIMLECYFPGLLKGF